VLSITKALGINFHKLYAFYHLREFSGNHSGDASIGLVQAIITAEPPEWSPFLHQMAVKGQSHQGSNKLFP